MNVLLFGGSGIISSATARELVAQGHEVWAVTRGTHPDELPDGVHSLIADIADEPALKTLLQGHTFDAAIDFIAFRPYDIQRDFRLLEHKIGHFIFISSASAYQKPLPDYRVREGMPLSNPYWEYARNKAACEDYLLTLHRQNGFPYTIVRPSHTYNETFVPLALSGRTGFWQPLKRMLEGKPTLLHGDGATLWTVTHARDVARGIVGLIGNIHAFGQAVNVVGDEVLTWTQVYECIASALGVKLNPFFASSLFLAQSSNYDLKSCLLGERACNAIYDNSRLKQLVPTFKQEIRFDQGIRTTIDHVLNIPALQEEDPEFDRWCDAVVLHAAQAAASIRRDAGMDTPA